MAIDNNGNDPSTLTTASILREVFMLRELIESRMDGYDKAISLLQTRNDKSPSIDVVAQNVLALTQVVDQRFQTVINQFAERDVRFDQTARDLKAVYDEKFRSIAVQFTERDTRTEQTSRDSKVAVDAALQAAKEAVSEQNKSSALAIGKSEASVTKQIDQLVTIIGTSIGGVSDKIDDLKARVGAVEGRSAGASTQVATHNASSGFMISVVSAIIAAGAVGVAIVSVVIN